MKLRFIGSLLGSLFIATAAFGQAQIPSGYVMGNSTASQGVVKSDSVTNYLDRAFGSTADRMLYRGASGWVATALTAYARTLIDDADATAARATLGAVIGTNVQAWDTDLDCLAALSTTGIVARTGAGTCAVRTLTAPAAGMTVTNGNGVSGDPTIALANDLAALEGLSGTGIARRTGTDAWSVGTTVTAAEGGTGQTSYAIGDILYASSSSALSKLADVATGNALISGGVGTAPSWGKIGLSTHVSGNLPVTNLNSGTGASSTTYWRGDGTWGTPPAGGTPGQLPGTTTNDNASAGNVGEDISGSRAEASALALTTNTPANITSISLTAGDWDVSGIIYFDTAGTTTLNTLITSISTTSATLDTSPGMFAIQPYTGTTFGTATISIHGTARRVSIASTTTVYLVAQAAFGTSTLSGWGKIEARRTR